MVASHAFLAFADSQPRLRFRRSALIAAPPSIVRRCVFASSKPIVRSMSGVSGKLTLSSASIFRLFGDKRLTAMLPLIWSHGSSGRNRPVAISPERILRLLRAPRDQAEVKSALASRTTGAPRQSATAVHRGRPRLPVPARLGAIVNGSDASGMASARALR
jgi:hypothetical protein